MKSLDEVGCGCWVVLKKEHWTTSKSFPLILKCAISTMDPILVSGGLSSWHRLYIWSCFCPPPSPKTIGWQKTVQWWCPGGEGRWLSKLIVLRFKSKRSLVHVSHVCVSNVLVMFCTVCQHPLTVLTSVAYHPFITASPPPPSLLQNHRNFYSFFTYELLSFGGNNINRDCTVIYCLWLPPPPISISWRKSSNLIKLSNSLLPSFLPSLFFLFLFFFFLRQDFSL